jgi:hypothetical protein
MSISLLQQLRQIYYSIFIFFVRLAFSLGIYDRPKIESFLDNDNKYILPLKTRFLKQFDGIISEPNANINHIFYDKKTFAEYMGAINSDSPLEKEWRTRILFESTPRGNIIMFYDAFKLGFSFYCDQKTISYDILNAAAMKYVTLFRCRHFFIDEMIVPKEHCSPMIKLYLTDEPSKTKEADRGAFAKLRNYSKPNEKIIAPKSNGSILSMFQFNTPKPAITQTDIKINEPEKMKNKFIYLGKIHNFKMTQYVPKKHKVLAKFTSPLLENIKLESTNLQRECMSYLDFKKSFVKS